MNTIEAPRSIIPEDLYDTPNDIPRPISRPLLISPNLRAALEYDELTRNNSITSERARPDQTADSSTPFLGLPPPPRPKSSSGPSRRTRPLPMPTPPLVADTAHEGERQPASSVAHISPSTPSVPSPNPYINPPPRLTHLLVDHSTTPEYKTIPEGSPRSSNDSHTGDSPFSDKGPAHSPLQTSPESAGTPGPSEGRAGFQRHLRYLSSLPKVEKMFVMGKSLGAAKQIDGKNQGVTGRRASDAGSTGFDGPDKLGKDVRPMVRQPRRRLLERGRTSSGESCMSAPSSPVAYSADAPATRNTDNNNAPETRPVWTDTVDGAETSETVAEAGRDPENVRHVGLFPETGPASAKHRLPARPLISHGRSHSAASTLRSNSSESSHEPPSTPHEPRISISSTIYQDSHYSIQYYPPFDAPFSPHPPHSGRSTMNSSDRESFIDLASPTFSPRLTDFSESSARSGQYSSQHQSIHSFNINKSSYSSRSKPSPSDVAPASASAKPPLPTSPKPNFNNRSRSAQPPHRTHTAESPQGQDAVERTTLPPTTNFLNPQKRAEGVRKTRKLAQMFGQTPGAIEAMAFSQLSSESTVPTGLLCGPTALPGLNGKRKHQRATASMSMNVYPASDSLPAAPWPPHEDTKKISLSSRRHSTPHTPDTASFLDDISSDLHSEDTSRSRRIEIGSQQGVPYSDWSSRGGSSRDVGGAASPTSFMDLSEEDVAGDGISSIITIETPKASRGRGILSPSSTSIYSFTTEDLEEEERRRKREKVAKLHRCLGSRVPTDLVLGQLSVKTSLSLPPLAAVSAIERPSQMDAEARKVWVRRRRSSSAAEFGGTWSEEIDRLKEELNDKEKALNVKRAVKMEKMFGVAPPQMLYHTRAVPPPASSTGGSPSASSPKQQAYPHSFTPPSRNVNKSSYKNKAKKNTRPGTAESSEPLMSSYGSGFGASEIYQHYRHSLNSLNDIIDRDDKESLERLHGIIHGDGYEPLQHFTRQSESPPSSPPTPKAERRRSLPSRTSMTSLSSEFSLSTINPPPAPEEVTFQARRKRAAKLTQFFGVDYRELMNEILESLEQGLEEEEGRGTLRPEEVQELLNKLRKLKTKRNSFLI